MATREKKKISTCLQNPQSSNARLAREYRGHAAVYAGFAVKQGAHTRMQASPANRSAHLAWQYLELQFDDVDKDDLTTDLEWLTRDLILE